MAQPPRPRYSLVSASIAVAASAVPVAFVTLWVLCVLPFALIVGICAWRGMTLAQTWERLVDESDGDAGRGPAGLGF